MGSRNLAREPAIRQPDEVVSENFREVGQILAEARKEKNLTIWQVAAQIHIRQQYLAGLEEGRLHDLPGRVYILGFIRTYARLLDLDGEELIRRVSTLPNLPNYAGSQAPMPMHAEEGPNLPVLVLSAIFIVLVAMGGYFFLKPSTNPISTEASLLDTLHLPESEVESQSAPSKETKASGQHPLEPFLATSPLIPDKPSALNEGTVVEKSVQPAKELEKPIKDASSPSKKITLKAREPSWVEIRDERSRVFFMRVMQRGEEFVIPDKPRSVLNTGNAGGIDIFVGDQKLPSLGARGEVKRGIHLDALQQ